MNCGSMSMGSAVNANGYTMDDFDNDYIRGMISDSDYVRILVTERGFDAENANFCLQSVKLRGGMR